MLRTLRSALFVGALLLPAAPAAAQVSQAEAQRILATSSDQEIVERLRASGMSRSQVRARLSALGYDPSMADRYFDALEAEGSLDGEAGEGVVQAMRDVGVLLRESDTSTVAIPDPDTVPDVTARGEPRLFGLELFRSRTDLFDALQSGAVGEDYELGPGDELLLVLTGDVELGYTLDVNREGVVVIPEVGEVPVAGRTLGELENVLYDRLGSRYSTLTRAPDATTRFTLSLGRLRTISIYVAGEVTRPGRYPVSSVATLLEALYAAGGPTGIASLRGVRVERDGRSLGPFDLYPWLTEGRTAGDIRLRQGDFLFVPPAERLVTLTGAVRRPAIFELTGDEGVPALVDYAGGLRPDAATERAAVDRVLPPESRLPGMERVAVDLPLGAVLAGGEFDLVAGDRIEVFGALEDVRSTVTVSGAVWRSGQYELRPGMSLGSLIDQAGGVRPSAYPQRVLVSRLDVETGRRDALRLPLDEAPGFALEEFDQVEVFSISNLLEADSVAVYGLVRNPGRYPLRRGMTAEDLILEAGGFRRGALPWEGAVAEPVRTAEATGELSRVTAISFSPELPYPDSEVVRPASTELPGTAASALALGPDFEVYVRQLPGFRSTQRVSVNGEIALPGAYALESANESLSTVLRRAGGPTDFAFLEGARLIRDGLVVGVDFVDALAEPGSDADPILQAGDQIDIPRYDATVRVLGAVRFETLVQYRDGMSLDDVIREAGGFRRDADEESVAVEYPNGRRSVVRKRLFFFSSDPDIRPGSTVTVPVRPEEEGGFDWDQALTRTLTVLSTVATVFIAVNSGN